jgi:hypothetical protein
MMESRHHLTLIDLVAAVGAAALGLGSPDTRRFAMNRQIHTGWRAVVAGACLSGTSSGVVNPRGSAGV